jgi:hypothetical protein
VERLIEIRGRTVFTLDDARAVLPIVFRITKVYSEKVEGLIDRIEAVSGHNEALATEIERQINTLIQEWQGKVERLGALPKGLWIADFDAGDGYYCWKYPERSIDYWHKYADGFSKRVHVTQRAPISLATPAASASGRGAECADERALGRAPQEPPSPLPGARAGGAADGGPRSERASVARAIDCVSSHSLEPAK